MAEDNQLSTEVVKNANQSSQADITEIGDWKQFVQERNVGRTLFWEALIRSGLSIIFASIFLVTIIFAFLHVSKEDWPQTKELLQILLPAETALLGSVVGFYFGTKKKE